MLRLGSSERNLREILKNIMLPSAGRWCMMLFRCNLEMGSMPKKGTGDVAESGMLAWPPRGVEAFPNARAWLVPASILARRKVLRKCSVHD